MSNDATVPTTAVPMNPVPSSDPTEPAGVLPGLEELDDDESWAAEVAPVAPGWKRAVALLAVLLVATGAFTLGAKLRTQSSTTGGAQLSGGPGAGAGRMRGMFSDGAGAGPGGFTQAATPTTIVPIVGSITEVDADILTLAATDGEEHIFAITDETVIARTRTVPAGDLAVAQEVSVEPADADGLVAKTITVTGPTAAKGGTDAAPAPSTAP